jgi:hypothetical protein
MTNRNDIIAFTNKFYSTLIKGFLEEQLNEWDSFIGEEFSKHEQSCTDLYCDKNRDDDDYGDAFYF